MESKPSPFLPGTKVQFAWDSTSLGWLKTCPRYYEYSMIEGYRLRSMSSVHLRFGQEYHFGLEYYDKQRAFNIDHETAMEDTVLMALRRTWDDGKPWDSGHHVKTRETLIRSLIWYLDHFGKDDPAETVLLANGKPAVELSFKLELDFGPSVGIAQPYVLCGHLDRVVTYGGGTYVMDRKTSSTTLSSYYFDQYTPDNQMSLYSLAAKIIYATPVKGVIIDAAQIAVGFTRFSRGFAYRTDAQLEEWLVNSQHWFALATEFATQNFWPMNDKSCHQYGGCPFRGVCSKSPDVRQRFLESDFVRNEWNPLVPR